MATRREALVGGAGALGLLVAGCSSVPLRSEDSDEGDGGPDRSTEGPPADAESDGSTADRDGPGTAAVNYEIEIDRRHQPRVGDPIDLEFTVSNDGKQSGAYDYRVRLEHEDGPLGGDERISGVLSSGSKEVFDFEFAPPRAGVVAVLVDDEIVDEFRARGRRDDDDTDDGDESEEANDKTGSVATGGEGTIVGTAASEPEDGSELTSERAVVCATSSPDCS
ncbi:hypothetical protein [Halostagnicola kamekurae]|uniref:CARDB protein n=1 Tax=Halostagnicola kamekurae TaxID=619731 RepID=A0A1I6NZV6_9EURY|nr:hypothetical protein [Halostagnicola kamekurae]SFS33375.1 hypothetical protein SAMN04488556_0226 [Halostagnicola kamekurae]